MPDFGIKLVFDSGAAEAGLSKTGAGFADLNKVVGKYEETVKTSTATAVRSLTQVQDTNKNLVGGFMKTGEAISTAFKSKQADIASVASAIAVNSKNASGFLTLINKLKDAKVKGIAVDFEQISSELEKMTNDAKLSSAQIQILNDNALEVGAALGQIQSQEFKDLADRSEEVTTKFKSAKTELRQLTNEISSGRLSGQDLVTARKRAGELRDTIGDVNDEINRLASDTKAFDNIADGVRLMGAGMQIAEGSAALFGDESKDLQKSLLKLNAIMALSNGLSQIAEDTTKKGTLANKAAVAAQNLWTAAIGGTTGAAKLFRIALISTGIGAIVILIGVLVANWDKVKKTVSDNSKAIFEYGKKVGQFVPLLKPLIQGIEWLYNNFDRLDNYAKGALAGIGEGFKTVGNVLSKVFSGDFSGAYEEARKVGQNIGKAVNDGIAEADKADANISLAKQIDGIVANQKKKAEVLKAGGSDTAKIEKDILNNELQALKLASADKEKIAEKEQEIAVFNAEQQKAAREKAKEEIEKQKKLYKEFIDELAGLYDKNAKAQRDLQLSSIDDKTTEGRIAKLKLQEEFDKKDLEQAEQKLIKLAKIEEDQLKVYQAFDDAKLLLAKKNNEEIISIEKAARAEYNKLVADSEKENIKIIADAKKKIAEDTLSKNLKSIQLYENQRVADIESELKYGNLSKKNREQLERQKLEIILASLEAQRRAFGPVINEETLNLDGLIKDTQKQLENFGKGLKKPMSSLKDIIQSGLEDAFGVNTEKSKALIEGFNALKAGIIDVINQGYAAEIASIDQSIKAREDKISQLEELIATESERKDAGYANDYNALVKQKADEEKLVKEDNKKRVEIQKEQLKIELAIQAAQQAGALAVAIANIFSKSSALGVFGIPIAIAGILTLIATFKSYKNQVKSLTAYKGGAIKDYLNPGQTGLSDRPGYGKGHKVEGTNLSIGADEFLINAGTTSKQMPFLRDLNNGKYDHLDLAALFGSGKAPMLDKRSKVSEFKEIKANRIADKEARQQANHEKALAKVIEQQTHELINNENRKPVVVNMPDGSIEETYYTKNGKNKVRRKVQ